MTTNINNDILLYISYLINDRKTLINYISVHKVLRLEANKRSFWKLQFDRFGLCLEDRFNYDYVYKWIQLFHKTKDLDDKITDNFSGDTKYTLCLDKQLLSFDVINIIKKYEGKGVNLRKKYEKYVYKIKILEPSTAFSYIKVYTIDEDGHTFCYIFCLGYIREVMYDIVILL